MGPRAVGRQRHRRRLQGCALFRGRRGALLLRRNVSDPESHPRQSRHRPERLRLRALFISPPTYTGEDMMDAPVTETQPEATLTLANVLYEKRDAIAYVTVNRPKVLNALNAVTWQDLRTAFADAQNDPAVRGVILTGAGDKAFIAGADIGDLAQASAVDAERSSRHGQEVLDLIEKLGKPVVAAINGFALGGGCE